LLLRALTPAQEMLTSVRTRNGDGKVETVVCDEGFIFYYLFIVSFKTEWA